MTAILPIAAVALQAGGTMFQAFSAQNQEKAAAKVDEENARLALLAGEQDNWNILRAERRAAGDAIVEMAGSGVSLGTGSAADVIAASAAQAELDIAARRQQARGEQANYLASANAHRAAGKAAVIGGLFNAASSVIAGASNMKNQQKLKLQGQWERSIAANGGRPPSLIMRPGFNGAGGSSLVDPRRYGMRREPGVNY